MMPEAKAEEQYVKQNDRIMMQDQMLSNTVQFGRIVEKEDGDPSMPKQGAYVLVHIGGEKKGSYTRNWMQWVSTRSGYDAVWWKPEIDEQVVVLAPSGNLKLGVIVGVISRGDWLTFPDKNDFKGKPKPEQKLPDEKKEHQHLQIYKDGSQLSYDRKTHTLAFQVKEKPEDKPGMDFNISLKSKNGQLSIKFGGDDKPKASVDISTENGFKFMVGENYIDFNGDDIAFKCKKLTLEASDGFQVISKKFNFDDSVKFEAKSGELTLDAGSKLVVSSSGVDVS